MTKDDDEDTAYRRVLAVLGELHENWRVYQIQISSEISEYKKTVNNAISLLAQEAFKHQSDTTARLEQDAIERRARQSLVDTATANVREDMLAARADMLQRLDSTSTRAERQRLALLASMGCLVLFNILALAALAALLLAYYWRPAQ